MYKNDIKIKIINEPLKKKERVEGCKKNIKLLIKWWKLYYFYTKISSDN